MTITKPEIEALQAYAGWAENARLNGRDPSVEDYVEEKRVEAMERALREIHWLVDSVGCESGHSVALYALADSIRALTTPIIEESA